MVENTTETLTLRLLVVSQDSAVLRPLWSIPKSNSWQIETAASGWDAIERVQSGIAPHVILLDLPRGDGDGLHVLRWLRRLHPDLPVIVICFPEDADRKREAIRLGAQEVLIRPFDETRLESVIRRHLVSAENGQADNVGEDFEQLGPDAFFISASPITQKLCVQAELLAEADVPVLILGETGSGKDTVARLIHKLSVRSGFKFLKVNCADMPGELLGAKLFGNERTSSPGISRTGPGKFERAERGTIFLDEITEMPTVLQTKLLRVLQNRQFFRLGGETAIQADVRILAATNENIEQALADKKLREDLYYRLSTFSVHVPPLRQRKDEIPLLLGHFMHRLAKHYGLPHRTFPATVLDACQSYAWPGNLRELENFVKRYLVIGDEALALDQLDRKSGNGTNNGNVWEPSEPNAPGSTPNFRTEECTYGLKSLVQNVKGEAERNAIAVALDETHWNRKAAAKLLKVSYRTLLYKIVQYHISRPESQLRVLALHNRGQGN